MDFSTTKYYAGKRDHDTHPYGGFHTGQFGVEMHGYKKDEIVQVQLEVIEHAEDFEDNAEPGIYFGVYFFEEKESRFIYESILATKVCSPSFFKNHIEDGQAVFVKLKVTEC